MSPAERSGPWRSGLPRAVVVVLVAVGLAGLTGALLLWDAWTGGWRPPPGAPAVQRVRLETGTTLDAFADSLAARGLLRHPWLFRLAGRLGHHDRRLRAGLYELPAGLPPRELLRRLVAGEAVPVRLTIPEGSTAEEVARIAAEVLGLRPDRFLAAADSLARAGAERLGLLGGAARVAGYDSILAGGGAAHPLHWSEGYLAPETYFLAEGTGPLAAVALLVGRGLDAAVAAAAKRRGAAADLTPHQLVTLASLVEAETSLPRERPLVAAVYLNRLRRGWLLQADPTVAYALGKRGQRLLYRDLEVDSPYNTYRHRGLPPGPIGNPGSAALAAAAAPARTDALFFVADGEGGHVFSRTGSEHEAAVRRYRRLQGGQSR